MANYRNHDRLQIEMKMMCINDFVPENHRARVIVSIVDEQDLSLFDEYYNNDNDGRKAYPIKDLLSLLIYSFLEGVYSARKIEKLCYENIVYRFLCCDDPPDITTISRFWKRFKTQIEHILIQTIWIGENEGLIDYKHLSGDGVKIKSMGSRNMIFNKEKAEKKLLNIEKRVKELSEEIINSNNAEEINIIERDIEHSNNLKNRIEVGLEELKMIQSNIKKEKESGKKIENTNYFHLTEKDSKLIKKRDTYISGYNAQAVSDSKNNMIVSCDVNNNVSDVYNGKPLLENTVKTIGIEKLKDTEFTFDNGYLEEDLLNYANDNNLDLYIATTTSKKMYKNTNDNRSRYNINNGLVYDEKEDVYLCPIGEKLIKKNWVEYRGNTAIATYERNCSKCDLWRNCFKEGQRKRKRKRIRLYSEDIQNKEIDECDYSNGKLNDYMNIKMSTKKAKNIYKKRLPNIEPVFAHIEELRKFRRFAVWGMKNVLAQWRFVCFVHNIYKIIKYSNYGRK